jgi:hypothetical protein
VRLAVALAAIGLVANAPAAPSPRTPLTVGEVIEGQEGLIGKRVSVQGRLSKCWKRSCGLYGPDPMGHERFLSIGPSPAFDASVAKLEGRNVEIEVTVTDDCMPPAGEPDLIVACADRARTLINPELLRTL